MTWLYLALLAYFINAVAFVTDKHLLSSKIPNPLSYAFGVSILSSFALILIPFGVSWYGYQYMAVSLVSGATFFFSLLFLYKSIKESDVSVASTNVGTLTAIFTYILSALILKDKLILSNNFAFIFLVLGILFMGIISKNILKYSVLAGLFMGLSLVLLKWTFNHSDYINGVFWTRIGFIGPALVSLLIPKLRSGITQSFKSVGSKTNFIFIFNKIIAGVGFIILYYSIKIGDVSLVNALLGTQFVFVLLLALILNKRIPGISENLSKAVLADKIVGIVFISIGFLLLFNK